MDTVALVAFGLALIALSLIDVALSVLHVQVESPVSNRVNRTLWRGVSWGARALPEWVRDRVLSWGLPLMIGTTILFWVVCTVVGFALVYTPFVHDRALVRTTVDATSAPFVDGLYFSAVTFLTLGYGDVVPVHPALRLAAMLEAALGLLTISLSVTYLLSVYPSIARKIALAAALNQETAGRADGVAVAARYVLPGRSDALGERLRWANDELLHLAQAHATYPLLFYARPREVHESFVRVLVLIQGIVATLRYALDGRAHSAIVGDPRLAILEEGLLYTLHGLDRSAHLSDIAESGGPTLRDDFDRLIAELRGAGLETVGVEALGAFARFRLATDSYIAGYALMAGYRPSTVRATYSRWARGAGLAPPPEATVTSGGATLDGAA